MHGNILKLRNWHVVLFNDRHYDMMQIWQKFFKMVISINYAHLHSKFDSVDKYRISHYAKKPVTTMLTYPWKCTVLHCNHLWNTWKPLVLAFLCCAIKTDKWHNFLIAKWFVFCVRWNLFCFDKKEYKADPHSLFKKIYRRYTYIYKKKRFVWKEIT